MAFILFIIIINIIILSYQNGVKENGRWETEEEELGFGLWDGFPMQWKEVAAI